LGIDDDGGKASGTVRSHNGGAGSPLSYWAGVHGINPMRYTGGMLGGSWLTHMMSDLGNGKFDGAYLVQNFENLNPANTLWSKQYNLYAKIDTEAPRYLGFERWWSGHINLTGEEIEYIVDNLFVGNKLSSAEMVTADGVRLDFRKFARLFFVYVPKAMTLPLRSKHSAGFLIFTKRR
jgi:hypothetical protein